MNTVISKGFVSISVLAFALAGCGGGLNKTPESAQNSQSAGTRTQVSSVQGQPPPAEAAAESHDYSYSGDEGSAPAPASAPAAEPQRSASAGSATRDRAAEKKSESFDVEQERPGLGTTWGETRSSRVSSAPFQRANPNNPFSVTSLHYNDSSGINAMLRGASLVDFRVASVPAARGMVTVRSETLNQAGEVVQIMTARLVVPRRPVSVA